MSQNEAAPGPTIEGGSRLAPETWEGSDSILPDQAEPVNLQTALDLAPRGWRAFPIRAGTKRPHITKWPERATTDETTIRRWWTDWPDDAVGIATGKESGLVVIDVDGIMGEVTFAGLQAQHELLPKTLEVPTPSGGRHLYFRHPGGYVKSTASQLGQDVDVRGDGGYVVAYELPEGIEPAELPPSWRALLQSEKPAERIQAPPGAGDGPTTGYGASALEDEAQRVAETPEGARNKALNNAGLRMGQLAGQGDLNLEEARQELIAAAVKAGLPEDEARRTVESGLRAGLEKRREDPLRRRVEHHKLEIRARRLAQEALEAEASIGLPLACPMGIEEFLARERLLQSFAVVGDS